MTIVEKLFAKDTVTGHRFRMINDFRRYDDEAVLNQALQKQTLLSFDFILNNPLVKESISIHFRPPIKAQFDNYFLKSNFFNYYQVYEPIPVSSTKEKVKRGWVSPHLLKSNYQNKKPPVFTLERSESLPQIASNNSDVHLLTHLSYNRSSKGFSPNRLSDKLVKTIAEDLKTGVMNAVINLTYFVDIKKKCSI